MLYGEQDKKMIHLMTFFYRHNREWIKYTDLLQFLHISRKTLRTYLDQLKELFDGLAYFDLARSMVKVDFNPNFGLITLQKTFLVETIIIKVLYRSFLNPTLNKLDLCIDLDTSESTIFRSCQALNEKLEKIYDLTYAYSDLQFHGPEREIQKFYINFFTETNPSPLKWLFDDVFCEESANTITRAIVKFIHEPIYPAHFIYIKVAIAVASIRFKQGFFIPHELYHPEILDHVNTVAHIPEVQAVLDKEFPDCHLDHTRLLYQILSYFFHDEFLFFFVDPKSHIGKTINLEENYEFFETHLRVLEDRYHLTVENPRAFYRTLFTYFKFKLSNVDATDFFINRSDYFLNYFKFFNPPFHNDLLHMLQCYLSTFHPGEEARARDLTYTVYTLWPDLIPQLLDGYRPAKALILSYYDHYYAKTLKNIINHRSDQYISCEVYDNYEIDFDAIRKENYDIIIADFVLPEDMGDALVFSFEQLPMVEKMQELLLRLSYRQIESTLDDFSEDFISFGETLGYGLNSRYFPSS